MKLNRLPGFAALVTTLLILPSVFAAPGPAPAARTQHLTSPDEIPQGLKASDWSSIREAYEHGRHAPFPVDGGYQARNPGQQWLIHFDGRGFTAQPQAGGWQWGLELRSYGFPGHERASDQKPRVTTAGQRVTYDWDDTLQEWFINDPRGLEHGFTVNKRPAGAPALNHQPPVLRSAPDEGGSTLNFLLAVRGSLVARVTMDGQGVLFCDDTGATVINYSGLKVWDADGKILPSRFEQVDGGARHSVRADMNEEKATPGPRRAEDCAPYLRLLVDERNARYPLTIDPIAQQAYLKASGLNNAEANDNFGYSVAVSGDTVVVGAYQEDSNATGVNGDQSNNSLGSSGAAYVFVRNGTTWSQQAYLKASNTGANDFFGFSVAVSGDTVVVGAYQEDSNALGVNGAGTNNSAADSGAAYVFVRSGTTWSQQAYLKASNTEAFDQFGYSVAVSGDTVVVGAQNEDSIATGVNGNQGDNTAFAAGAAYVFVRSGTNWTQQAYVKASNTGTGGDMFGNSLAVWGDTLVVAARNEDSNATGVNGNQSNNSASSSGAAYVFVRSGTVWSQQAYLKASNTESSDGFGYTVALASNTIAVGAPYEASNATTVNGNQGDNSASIAGAAYVFVRSGTVWSQQAYLKPSNMQSDDQFGSSVAASGDTVVVGSRFEDSNAVGVNGDGSNNSAAGSGAAYVFVRSGTTWSQQAYLKASNTGAGDDFSIGVAVSGDTIVVGAEGEDSNAIGANGNQNDNSAGQSGAAYIFVRNGAVWSQQAYVKPFNTRAGEEDIFGLSVAVSGDTVVVGARQEDSNSTFINGNQADNSAANAGAAYVFVRNGGTWSQQAYLKAFNAQTNDSFGYSVAIFGDTVVVGAVDEDSNATGVNGNPGDNSASSSGAAYVFVRSGTTWSLQAYLKASNTEVSDSFGYSVAVSGDTIVVGARGEDSNATGVNGNQSDNNAFESGAAYVFVRSSGTWSQQAYLKASNTGKDDLFGYSVAVSGDTVVVSAPQEASNATGVNGNQNDNSGLDCGAAYVFVRSSGTWSQQAYLKASNTEAFDLFGLSVAVSGDTIVVGALFEDSNAIGVNGNQSDNNAPDAGAAYVFARNGTIWSQQAYLKASNPDKDDNFGVSVSVSGDVIVVGAGREDSNATGVNGNQSDNSVESTGAAYVFMRSGTTWSQQAYLKASNPGNFDYFGQSVAVSGDTVIVGAYGEASSATGVNGNQSDNGASESGAAYIFTGLGSPLQLTIVRDGSGGYFIRFNGIPDLTYPLQRAPGVTGPFNTIATLTAPAPGLVEYHDTSPLPGQAYYRAVYP